MRVLLASLLLLASSCSYAQSFGSAERRRLAHAAGPEFLPVEEAYQLEVEVLESQGVRLYWQIADSYYLYQHRFGFTLEDAAGRSNCVELPPALQRTTSISAKYRSTTTAPISCCAPVNRRQATLTVSSQGCADAGLCYPPQKQYFDWISPAAA